MRPSMRLAIWVALGAITLTAVPACSDGGSTKACSSPKRERVDGSSSLHLLPGAAEPKYLSEPPTSGPHRSGPAPKGVQTAPLDRSVQVAVLEQGGVLIQYKQSRYAKDLNALANEEKVVVAPNPDLADPIVATSWAYKQKCSRIDINTLNRFINDRPSIEPSHQ